MSETKYESMKEVESPKMETEVKKEEEKEEEEEEEPKVSTLELFSDLVIVVSIHVVAEPLEEKEFYQFGLYFARVFYLWLAWHTMTLYMNASVKMKSHNCPVHNLFVAIWMGGILHMSQAFSINDDVSAMKNYLGLAFFEMLIFIIRVHIPYRKGKVLEDGTMMMSCSESLLKSLQNYCKVLVIMFLVCQLLPLTLAIYIGGEGEKGTVYFPMVVLSIVMIVATFLFSAMGENNGVDTIDVGHIQERYELITLIFTGELCFAAGKPGNAVGSYGVMFMAFAAYLLTFKAYPLKGHIKFWARSVLHSVVGLFLYAGVFCAIPAMGSAFARIIEGGNENDGQGEGAEAEEYEGGGEEEELGGVSAGDLLCYSAGAFMVFTAMLNLINIDPVGPLAPKISSFQRGLTRVGTGCVIWSLSLIPEDVEYNGAPVVTLLVPALALFSTVVEVWAVGSLVPAL